MPASTAPAATAPPPSRGALLVVFLTVFIDLLGFGIVLPVMPRQAEPYLQALGLSPVAIGAVICRAGRTPADWLEAWRPWQSALVLALYVAAMKDIAADKKCGFVDLHGIFLEAIQKKPADKQKWLTSDNVHMAPAGDALMSVGMLRGLGVPDAKIAEVDLSKK